MKKASLMILCVLLIGAPLFAGGKKDSKPADSGKKQLVFGYLTQSLEFDWCKASADAFQYACDQKGVKALIMDPRNNVETQMSQFEDLINQKVDGISVYTLTPELDKQMADRGREAGIPIVFENSKPSDDTNYIACVACEYADIGYAAMKYISQNYPGAKIFYCQGQPGMGVLEEYIKGVDKGLKEFTNISIVAKQPTDWGAEQALNVTQNVIQSGVKFDVVFANNEQMATGVVRALEDSGLKGKVKVVATGGGNPGLDAIKAGELDATMSAPVCIQGVTICKNLWDAVHGKTPPKFTPLPILPIDKNNLSDAILWTSYDKALQYIGGIN